MDDYETPEDQGYIHEDELPNIEHTREHLLDLIHAVYETGDIDVIEDRLDELCGQFDIDYTPLTPKIRKDI